YVWDFFAEQDRVARSRGVLDRMLALSAGAPEEHQVLRVRAFQAMMEDDIAEARATATRAVELSAQRVSVHAVEVGYALTYIGDVDAAAAAMAPLIESFRRDGALFALAKALCVMAGAEHRRGQYGAALSAATEALGLSEEAGIPYLVCLSMAEL